MATRIFHRYLARTILKPAPSILKPRFGSLLPSYQSLVKPEKPIDMESLNAKYPNAQSFLDLCRMYELDEHRLVKAIETRPEITHFDPSKITNNIQQFYNLGFEPVNIATIILNYPVILDYDGTDITDTFEAWRSGHLHERFLRQLFVVHSWLFQVNNDEVKARLSRIFYLMNHKINRVTKLLLNAPTIMLGDWNEVEDKFLYCMKEMRYLEKEISRSTVLAKSMSFIKLRHIFLERVGVYVRPSMKDEVGINPHKNPSLFEIIDTDDDQFAMNTAKVSPEEYKVFMKLMRYEDEDFDYNENVKLESEFDYANHEA